MERYGLTDAPETVIFYALAVMLAPAYAAEALRQGCRVCRSGWGLQGAASRVAASNRGVGFGVRGGGGSEYDAVARGDVASFDQHEKIVGMQIDIAGEAVSPAWAGRSAGQPFHLRVVLASPSDVQAERDLVAQVVGELNRTLPASHGVFLDLLRWEVDARPGFHAEGGQGVIDRTLKIVQGMVAKCDRLLIDELGEPEGLADDQGRKSRPFPTVGRRQPGRLARPHTR